MSTVIVGQGRRRPKVRSAERRAFLAALDAGHTVMTAAASIGVHKQRLYELRRASPAFAEKWDAAYASGTETLIEEVRRRALEGWDEPVFQGGREVGVVRKYSENLLMFLVKQRDPSFRENTRLEVTGAGGGPVEVAAGFVPTTLADVLALARQLGLDQPDVIDGTAVEVDASAELTDGAE